MRLLIAEDDLLLGEAVQKMLVRDGFAVDWVVTGSDFFEAAGCHDYDFVILDLNLPDSTGEQILLRLRDQHKRLPVMVMSSRRKVHDRVTLLNMGADDFLVKPFDLDELTARIRSILRRVPLDNPDQDSSVCGSLSLHSHRCAVTLDGQQVALTHREFRLLEVLVRKKHQIVSRSQIEETLYGWGEEIESNAVEVYVHMLRRKLRPDLIQTVRGRGYQLSPSVANA